MKLFIFVLTFISSLSLALPQNECLPTRCSPTGPTIRFPFRLKDRQPVHCGSPGFELSCTTDGTAKLDIQFPVTASTNGLNTTVPLQITVLVRSIDYREQKMLASNAKAISCLPEKNVLITTLSSSNAPTFEVEAIGYREKGYTLFNCSGMTGNYGGQRITCLGSRGYEVIMLASFNKITSLPPYSSCFKMYDISYVPYGMLTGESDGYEYSTQFYLRWREPPPRSHKPIKAGIITAGTVILFFIAIASYFILRSIKREKQYQKAIGKILESHKATMRPTRYTYTDIVKITRNFSDVAHATALHEGMLVDRTRVLVKMIDCSDQTIEDFIRGVEIVGRMEHANLLKLTGYCADRRERALVYEYVRNWTLEDFTMPSDEKNLLLVALGMAKGINYVSQNDISLDSISSKDILLDDNYDPKILVFPAGAVDHSFADLSEKADVFCFGMLLLEVVGRRRNVFLGGEKGENGIYFPEWIYSEMSRDEEDTEGVVKKVSIVGLRCIQWFPSDRPSMECAVQMLQGDGVPLMPPNPFASC